MPDPAPPALGSLDGSAAFRDAIRYWERRRVVYNLALITMTGAWVISTWPHFRPAFTRQSVPPLAVLATLANLCYCAAYLVEALVRDSGLDVPWRRRRWVLWLAGTILALLIENYWIADEIYPYVPFVR